MRVLVSISHLMVWPLSLQLPAPVSMQLLLVLKQPNTARSFQHTCDYLCIFVCNKLGVIVIIVFFNCKPAAWRPLPHHPACTCERGEEQRALWHGGCHTRAKHEKSFMGCRGTILAQLSISHVLIASSNLCQLTLTFDVRPSCLAPSR